VLPEFKEGEDVGVVTKLSHGPGLAFDAGPGFFIQFLGFQQGKGDIPVQQRVTGQVDLLLAALAQDPLTW